LANSGPQSDEHTDGNHFHIETNPEESKM
jgi:hypothetical protein